MKIEIKRWDNGEIIICGEYKSVKDCLQKNKDKSFSGADLNWADLSSADLSSANLRSADLNSANLRSADLHSADLSWVNLSSANLHSADLSSANLRSANLNSANLHSADLSSANLRSADLNSANLRSADLYSADLRSAKLNWADLRSANLNSANLHSADLSSANLRSANLSSVETLNKYLTTPLYSMLDQKGNIIAYKIVNQNNEGIYNGGLVYKIGEGVEIKNADTNENNQCGAGINLATLDWCVREWKKGYKILLCEFRKEDIACIPIGSDGKFRVYRCKIVGKKNLKELGLVK